MSSLTRLSVHHSRIFANFQDVCNFFSSCNFLRSFVRFHERNEIVANFAYSCSNFQKFDLVLNHLFTISANLIGLCFYEYIFQNVAENVFVEISHTCVASLRTYLAKPTPGPFNICSKRQVAPTGISAMVPTAVPRSGRRGCSVFFSAMLRGRLATGT